MIINRKKDGPGNICNYVQVGYRRAWAMWDLDNGHFFGKNDPGKGYIWLFPTREEALKHRREQHKKKFCARLSYPFKIECKR